MKEDRKLEFKADLCLGADGCRGGWITAVLDRGELRLEKYASIGDIIRRYPKYDEFLIDMAIGLRDRPDQLRPDDIARKELSPRGSTLFPIPSRSAVYAETEEEQKQANLRTLGKSLSKQTINIIPKIREMDEFLTTNPAYTNRILESHPGLCFARLNGEVLMSKKNESEGLKQRLDILKAYIPDITWSVVQSAAKSYKCNPDDILDAVCLAVTAGLKAKGSCETIPEEDKIQKDEKGLEMKLTVPRKDEKGLEMKLTVPQKVLTKLV